MEYYYKQVEAWQVSEPGVEVFYFQSGQREAHHEDGSREIIYPDGSCSRVTGAKEHTTTFQSLSETVKQAMPCIVCSIGPGGRKT